MATKIAVSMVDGPLESEIFKSASDPTSNSNPSNGVGTIWANTTTGELYTCTDATTDANVWMNVGGGSGNLQSNPLPGMPDDNFVSSLTMNTSNYNHIFVGGTDTGSSNSDIAGAVTHYVVDQISDAALTVAASEVAASSAHVFTTGSVGSDTNVTFRVRSKDNEGGFSADRIISLTVSAFTGAVATGGSVSTQGDYKVHTFTTSGTFTVTDAGSEGTVEHLTVAGGGGGGKYNRGGGGGSGGYLAGTTAVTATTYNIVVGGGGSVVNVVTVGGTLPKTSGWSATSNHGNDSSFSTNIAVGGGEGGAAWGWSGGSGGGKGEDSGGAAATWPTQSPKAVGDARTTSGQSTIGQGNGGGNSNWTNPVGTSGGGGGAGAAGANAASYTGGVGGVGTANSISGSSVYYAGGGGGGVGRGSNMSTQGTAGGGGNGGGGIGAGGASHETQSYTAPTAGSANTGGGGGGSGYNGATGYTGNCMAGGSGIVIIKYKFQ
jgi:hypothetical protein